MTIRTETKKRISQAGEHGYLGYEVSSPMLYLNSGELISIICSDAYWKHFAKYFRASKQIVVTKLAEIGTVRNALAHFRPIRQDDIDLVKQNSRHVLQEIENCLVEITSIADVVPTNSELAWYKEIKAIGNAHLTTALFTSHDGVWVRVELSHRSTVLQNWKYGDDYLTSNVTSLRVSQLFVLHLDVVEYWGVRWNYTTDFIASTAQYPWMPSSVSKDELPF